MSNPFDEEARAMLDEVDGDEGEIEEITTDGRILALNVWVQCAECAQKGIETPCYVEWTNADGPIEEADIRAVCEVCSAESMKEAGVPTVIPIIAFSGAAAEDAEDIILAALEGAEGEGDPPVDASQPFAVGEDQVTDRPQPVTDGEGGEG